MIQLKRYEPADKLIEKQLVDCFGIVDYAREMTAKEDEYILRLLDMVGCNKLWLMRHKGELRQELTPISNGYRKAFYWGNTLLVSVESVRRITENDGGVKVMHEVNPLITEQ